MICQFSFSNFKSYKEETTLDFQASPISEFADSLIKHEKASDLLPVSVVYGPNGGGKSNLLQALSFLAYFVVRPVYELKKNRRFVYQKETECVPFAFDGESSSKPTSFLVYFRVGENEYSYSLKINAGEIEQERLLRKAITGKKPALIFHRDKSRIELGFGFKRRGIATSINPLMPYLSFLAINYQIEEISEAMGFFEGCLVLDYGKASPGDGLNLAEELSFKDELIKALNDLDIDISDFYFDEDRDAYFTKRKIGKRVYALPLSQESEGTRKLLEALPLLLLSLKEGRLCIVDELDAKLHPKLLRYVISLYKRKDINRHGAQLLFTSHDVSTLKNTVYRRDEVWFAYEGEDHGSQIYSLYEIRGENNERIRANACFDKQYLEGRYGADPYLSNMLGDDFV